MSPEGQKTAVSFRTTQAKVSMSPKHMGSIDVGLLSPHKYPEDMPDEIALRYPAPLQPRTRYLSELLVSIRCGVGGKDH